MSYRVKYQSATLPENEWLDAKLAEIEGEDGDIVYNENACFRFVFELTGPERSGRRVSVLTSQRLTPGAKLTGLVSGLLGRELSDGDEIDLVTFVGQTFQVMVEATEKQGRTYYNVAKTRPDGIPNGAIVD